MADFLVGSSGMAGMAEEVTVNFAGGTISAISSLRGARAEDVLQFTVEFHRRRFGRCARVRVAGLHERPEGWVVKPLPGRVGLLWVVAVDWDEVVDGHWPILAWARLPCLAVALVFSGVGGWVVGGFVDVAWV